MLEFLRKFLVDLYKPVEKSNGTWQVTGLQINLYLEQLMEIQLFATFFQRRK
jgi:hypothetical protein